MEQRMAGSIATSPRPSAMPNSTFSKDIDAIDLQSELRSSGHKVLFKASISELENETTAQQASQKISNYIENAHHSLDLIEYMKELLACKGVDILATKSRCSLANMAICKAAASDVIECVTFIVSQLLTFAVNDNKLETQDEISGIMCSLVDAMLTHYQNGDDTILASKNITNQLLKPLVRTASRHHNLAVRHMLHNVTRVTLNYVIKDTKAECTKSALALLLSSPLQGSESPAFYGVVNACLQNPNLKVGFGMTDLIAQRIKEGIMSKVDFTIRLEAIKSAQTLFRVLAGQPGPRSSEKRSTVWQDNLKHVLEIAKQDARPDISNAANSALNQLILGFFPKRYPTLTGSASASVSDMSVHSKCEPLDLENLGDDNGVYNADMDGPTPVSAMVSKFSARQVEPVMSMKSRLTPRQTPVHTENVDGGKPDSISKNSVVDIMPEAEMEVPGSNSTVEMVDSSMPEERVEPHVEEAVEFASSTPVNDENDILKDFSVNNNPLGHMHTPVAEVDTGISVDVDVKKGEDTFDTEIINESLNERVKSHTIPDSILASDSVVTKCVRLKDPLGKVLGSNLDEDGGSVISQSAFSSPLGKHARRPRSSVASSMQSSVDLETVDSDVLDVWRIKKIQKSLRTLVKSLDKSLPTSATLKSLAKQDGRKPPLSKSNAIEILGAIKVFVNEALDAATREGGPGDSPTRSSRMSGSRRKLRNEDEREHSRVRSAQSQRKSEAKFESQVKSFMDIWNEDDDLNPTLMGDNTYDDSSINGGTMMSHMDESPRRWFKRDGVLKDEEEISLATSVDSALRKNKVAAEAAKWRSMRDCGPLHLSSKDLHINPLYTKVDGSPPSITNEEARIIMSSQNHDWAMLTHPVRDVGYEESVNDADEARSDGHGDAPHEDVDDARSHGEHDNVTRDDNEEAPTHVEYEDVTHDDGNAEDYGTLSSGECYVTGDASVVEPYIPKGGEDRNALNGMSHQNQETKEMNGHVPPGQSESNTLENVRVDSALATESMSHGDEVEEGGNELHDNAEVLASNESPVSTMKITDTGGSSPLRAFFRRLDNPTGLKEEHKNLMLEIDEYLSETGVDIHGPPTERDESARGLPTGRDESARAPMKNFVLESHQIDISNEISAGDTFEGTTNDDEAVSALRGGKVVDSGGHMWGDVTSIKYMTNDDRDISIPSIHHSRPNIETYDPPATLFNDSSPLRNVTYPDHKHMDLYDGRPDRLTDIYTTASTASRDALRTSPISTPSPSPTPYHRHGPSSIPQSSPHTHSRRHFTDANMSTSAPYKNDSYWYHDGTSNAGGTPTASASNNEFHQDPGHIFTQSEEFNDPFMLGSFTVSPTKHRPRTAAAERSVRRQLLREQTPVMSPGAYLMEDAAVKGTDFFLPSRPSREFNSFKSVTKGVPSTAAAVSESGGGARSSTRMSFEKTPGDEGDRFRPRFSTRGREVARRRPTEPHSPTPPPPSRSRTHSQTHTQGSRSRHSGSKRSTPSRPSEKANLVLEEAKLMAARDGGEAARIRVKKGEIFAEKLPAVKRQVIVHESPIRHIGRDKPYPNLYGDSSTVTKQRTPPYEAVGIRRNAMQTNSPTYSVLFDSDD